MRVNLALAGWGALTLSLLVSGCSFRPNWESKTWTKGDRPQAAPEPTHLDPTPFAQGTLRGRVVELQNQELSGVPIADSYVKRVKKDGELNFAKATYVEGSNLPPASLLKALKYQAAVEHKSQGLETQLKCHWTSAPKPILMGQPRWRLRFFRFCESSEGFVWRVTLNTAGRVVQKVMASAAFDLKQEFVSLYPKGPKRSQLERLELNLASEPYYLFTPELSVTSDSGFKFADLSDLSKVTPEAESFDLLQTYYYATEAVRWAHDHLNFEIKNLKIRTQVGYPQKSNVAFYFAHEVRLGTGDDVSFSHIPWDASIVTHESMHEVVTSLTGLPFQGEGGSLQEALADTLTALQLDNPAMGEDAYKKGPFQRTLDNASTVSDRNGGLYHDSLIVSGTLWDIRKQLGEKASEDVTAFLLSRLTPDSGFAQVGVLLRQWPKELCNLEAPDCEKLASIIDRRGW